MSHNIEKRSVEEDQVLDKRRKIDEEAEITETAVVNTANTAAPTSSSNGNHTTHDKNNGTVTKAGSTPTTKTVKRRFSQGNTLKLKGSRLEYLANLDVYRATHFLRRTGIVCTIGPNTSSVEMLVELRKAGVNLIRINLSHNEREFHQLVLDNLQQSYKLFPGPQVAIALDVRGSLIHLGGIDGGEFYVKEGHKMKFSTDPKRKGNGNAEVIYIDFPPNFISTLHIGDILNVEFGRLKFAVLEIEDDGLVVEAQDSGIVVSYEEVLLPGVHADMEPLKEEDFDDIQWGITQGIDILLATIRKPRDVHVVKEALGSENSYVKIVSKVTSDESLQQFAEILKLSDGIMIARGDIGVEILPEKVFLAQKMMISKCNLAGKSVICSTQMLESMTKNRQPTRAEVSDVANAVLDGADCVMLSSETEKGKYPIESVKIMHRVCAEAESIMFHRQKFQELNDYHDKKDLVNDTEETVAIAAVYASYAQKAAAIVCLTTSGRSAALVSKYRPLCPILAVTRENRVTRNLHMYRGIFSMTYPHLKSGSFQDDIDSRIGWGIAVAKHAGYISTGDTIIAIQGWRDGMGHTNTVRVLVVD